MSDAIWVKVVIDNATRNCADVAVSSYLAGVRHDRPDTVVTFGITNESGVLMTPTSWSGTRPLFRPRDLFVLRCGALHGWSLPLKVEWEYKLPAGRYRLTARVENRVGVYFQTAPKQLQDLAKDLDLAVADTRPLLRDFVAESDAVEFVVE